MDEQTPRTTQGVPQDTQNTEPEASDTQDTQVTLETTSQGDDEFVQLPMVVAVDLGGTQIRTAVLRGSKLLSRIGLLTGENPSPDRIMPRLFQAVRQAVEKAHVPMSDIKGIGIGAPGPLDNRTGTVFSPPNLPGWDNVPVRDLFNKEFHVPIYVENDANAAALGEYMFGAGRGSRDMVYLTISTGIGGGVITDGKIIEGVSGTAAELGHMTVDWHGERCNCGNIGCLERIASGTNIARRANEAIAVGRGNDLLAFALEHQRPQETQEEPMEVTAAETQGKPHTPFYVNSRTVAQAAEAGIPVAQEIILRAAEAIGVGLVNIIHIFNPEMIILGGGVTQMGPLLLDPVMTVVQERAMKVPRKACRIMLAQLGQDVGLVGAGALIYYYGEQEK